MHSPEEQNRKLIDAISTLNFCADRDSYNNLKKEGKSTHTFLSGSTAFDAIRRSSQIANQDFLKKIGVSNGKYVLCTLHRQENMEDLAGFKEKIEYINWITGLITVVFPMHPRTKKFMKKERIQLSSQVIVLDPVPHLPFTALLRGARIILSDSGGIQEEAAFFDRPCLVLRAETEWKRLIKAKKNFLIPKVGVAERKLTQQLILQNKFYTKVRNRKSPGSRPGASKFIVRKLLQLEL
jgi:UDP-N-acetylglucosamine 2-epimerase